MNRKQGTPRPRKGFTLAELLIVVAIIAVLVAIAIPIFTSQLEKSRESVDLSNVRAAYAEVMSAAMTEDGTAQYGGAVIKQADGTFQATVSPLKQQQDDWAVSEGGLEIGGVPYADWNAQEPKAHGSCTVRYDPGSGKVTIDWGGTGGSPGGDPDPADPTPTAAEQAAAANQATISTITEKVNKIVQGAANNTQIIVRVDASGQTTITSGNNGGGHSGNNEETVASVQQALIDAGVLTNDNGTLIMNFATGDPNYPKGYTITFHHNNSGKVPTPVANE